MGEKMLMDGNVSGSNFEEQSEKKGQVFVITRNKAIVLAIIVVAIIIFVGVMSGVLSAKKARKDALDEAKRDRRQGSETASSATSATVVTPTEKTGPEPWYKIRLPENIRPLHYDFYLDPYLEQNTFQGNVTILIEVTAASEFMSYILIHINDMNVTRAKVYKQSADKKSDTASPGNEVALKRTFEYPKNDFFIFELEKDLKVEKYVVRMEYKSTFSSQLNGLYISTYTNEKGENR